MDKIVWKSTREWPYFLSNVLVGVKIVFLPDYLLVFSLLRHRGVEIFLNQKKKWKSQTGKPLNNSIIVYIYIYI